MSHINPMTSNNKFNSSGNDHPENQGDFQSNNPNVPNSYFELLAMQGGVNTKTKNINEIHDLPELIPAFFNSPCKILFGIVTKLERLSKELLIPALTGEGKVL